MTPTQAQVILTLAKCNMNVSEASRQLYMHRNSLAYHLEKIKAKTGLNPLYFYDLYKLTEMAKGEKSDG